MLPRSPTLSLIFHLGAHLNDALIKVASGVGQVRHCAGAHGGDRLVAATVTLFSRFPLHWSPPVECAYSACILAVGGVFVNDVFVLY